VTLQNRVLPTGEIVAIAARGTFTGNRGILHDDQRRLGTARWRHKAWIVCALQFKGIRRVPMTPGRWTELFFLDEAVALAAGHRPCAYCRRAAFNAFRSAWTNSTTAEPSAPEMDAVLHKSRVRRDRTQIRRKTRAEDLPPGAFILWHGTPHLVTEEAIHPYSSEGYGPILTRPSGPVTVLTPAPNVAALAGGYRPQLHQSATAAIT